MRPRTYTRLLIGIPALMLLGVVAVNTLQSVWNPRPTAVAVADEQLGWRFCGVRNQQELGLGDHLLRFDARGCRGVDQPAESLRGRAVYLGNSVTLGQHVPEESTFASLAHGINAGGDGYDTYQQILHFRRDLADLTPSKVFLMVVGIDLMSAVESQERMRTTAAANPDLAPWFKRLTDFRAARRILRRGFQPTGVDPKHNPGRDRAYLTAATALPAMQAWHDWTDAVAKLAKEIGPARLVLVLSPPRVQVEAWRSGRREGSLAEAIKEFCAAQGITFSDILPDLAAHDPEEIYVDHVHFSPRGHAAVAAALRRAGLQ